MYDIAVVGGGPVGLLCTYLAGLNGLSCVCFDRSAGPLAVGRADALNARSLQLFELVDLFEELYPLGKTCNTSSVWADGKFVSRQSAWWEALEGCLHKHFLMIGQAYVERLLDSRLTLQGAGVVRSSPVVGVEVLDSSCVTRLENGATYESRYVIGADGSRSIVRQLFEVPFEVVRPEIVWAVIDGEIETDFPKVPEIIVFQNETSDVAWIPREGGIDRFYVQFEGKDFAMEEAFSKINRAMRPHTLSFKSLAWTSKFSVKESVAEHFRVRDRVFLAGDAAHIHSVNGGQGLNTGLADAFNLIWKLNAVLRLGAPEQLLQSYEAERKPVALSVVETSGALVRSTKHSATSTHAKDYVEIVRQRAGNITGMGIRYGSDRLVGSRLYDMEVHSTTEDSVISLYSRLRYDKFTLLGFGDNLPLVFPPELPPFVQIVRIACNSDSLEESESASYFKAADAEVDLWVRSCSPYTRNMWILVRPDSYIAHVFSSTSEVPRVHFDWTEVMKGI